jgi:DNA-binding MarR family transcriptional regulator
MLLLASMERLEKKLKIYLGEVTGRAITVHPHGVSHLPYFLTRLYDLFDVKIGSVSYTAVFLKQEDEFKPVQFLKHLAQIPEIQNDDVCVVAESLPSYVRKRMIEKGLSFVIPNVQMFLPGMGMELRSRSVGKKSRKRDYLSPATQVVLIHWLLGRFSEPVTPLELSKQLYYSTMTMSRALDELEVLEIGHVERRGRERLLTFTMEKQAVWQAMLPRLKNPVRYLKRIAQRDLHSNDALPAGLTALSKQSMIGEPDLPEYAVSSELWKNLEKEGVKTIPLEEYGTCVIQVWRYDPKILELNGMVDPFSLYLSFQGEADDRIEMALEEMMEKYL